MKNNVTAVLLAGGMGTRFDPKELKTLYKIKNKTLTEIVIDDIKSSNLFDEIILVYNEKHKKIFKRIVENQKIKLIENGTTRFFSALNGLEMASSEKIIFIDVAAPFYQHEMLQGMIKKLDKYDGVMTTVLDSRADHVLVKDDKVLNVFKRGEVLRVKSYQGINKTKWLKAFQKTSKSDRKQYTEMLKILIDNNYKVGNVLSENNPRKITTKDDLRFFK